MKLKSPFNWAGIILLTAVFFGGAGCQTQSGGAGPLASVVIPHQPLAKVQNAIADVFAENGFLGGQSGANEFTYTRIGVNPVGAPASVNDTARVRAVVTTAQAENGDITVSCNAWLLNNSASHVQAIRRWPYQQLLNEVKSDVAQ